LFVLYYSMSTIVEKYPPISLLLNVATYLYCCSLIEYSTNTNNAQNAVSTNISSSYKETIGDIHPCLILQKYIFFLYEQIFLLPKIVYIQNIPRPSATPLKRGLLPHHAVSQIVYIADASGCSSYPLLRGAGVCIRWRSQHISNSPITLPQHSVVPRIPS